MISETEKKALRPYDGERLRGRYIILPRYALDWGLSPFCG